MSDFPILKEHVENLLRGDFCGIEVLRKRAEDAKTAYELAAKRLQDEEDYMARLGKEYSRLLRLEFIGDGDIPQAQETGKKGTL